jgi:hypothetical protein
MTLRSQDPDDRAFTAAWAAFLREDAEITAPRRLERKVMEAVRSEYAQRNGVRRIARRRLLSALAIAAAVLLVLSAALRRSPSAPSEARDDTPMAMPALMTLAADPVRETESLQLVRIRVPRTELRALGIALIEPDASGLVDVDVLVADDGLPRDIRRIQPVLTTR